MSLRRRFASLSVAVLWTVGLVASVAPVAAANDPALRDQWGMTTIGAPSAWSAGTGRGVTIAVVDTGVDFGHEDLAGKVLPGRNFVDPGRPPQDDHGHGTHVAGIAAAVTGNGKGVAGTAPHAQILPVKVLDAGGAGSADAVAAGIRWAASSGAHVINLSLGPDVPLVGSLFGTGLEEAVNEAWAKGAVVVVAAGNDALFSSSYSNVKAIVVTGTGRNDEDAGYSGVGRAAWGMAAPGGTAASGPDGIVSTFWPNKYRWLAGTSMAAPHVAGAAAVLRSLGLSPQQTVDRLLASAKDLGPAGRDSVFGAGRLDLAAAVRGLGAGPSAAATPPAPPPPAPRVATTVKPARTRAAPAPAPAPLAAPAPPAPAPPPPPPAPEAAAEPSLPPPEETPAQPPAAPAVPMALGDAPLEARAEGRADRWLPLALAATALAGAGVAAWRARRSLARAPHP